MAESARPVGQQVIEPGTVRAPEFPRGLDWLNTEAPLTIAGLRGKIVILDFWTYCCINCLHALEDLKRLERKYPDELVVIGVHCAKFPTEKDTESIREAVLRYGIEHPVVNDSAMRIWQQYSVRAWPSFMLIDPLGRVFGTHSGERVFDLFEMVLAQMVEKYDSLGVIRRGPIPARLEADSVPDSVLSYPGKVLADEAGGRLFIADTNHHRIVVADLGDGSVLEVIGSGERGFADGPAGFARFAQPQGMALSGDDLYIADTGNHAVRAADLAAGMVRTIAGDGQQDLEWHNAPGPLEGRRLNSPWDLQLAHGVLFVAMAGNHQIFGIDLEGGYIACHAGSGREDHVDGPLMAAALAQPSGLTTDGENLFVADSEVSSIRAVALDPRGGHVRTVVGKGLFDFGDVDGIGQEVRLQHPLGVAFFDGKLFVADTYNCKIKTIALPSLSTRTLAGSGVAGQRDGVADEALFDEPGGLSCTKDLVFVADTNNHAIRTVDPGTGAVSSWHLRNTGKLILAAAAAATLPELQVRPGAVSVTVRFELPDGYGFASQASSGVTIRAGDRVYPIVLREGRAETSIEIDRDEILHIELVAYCCGQNRSGTCFYIREARNQPLRIDPSGGAGIALQLGGHPYTRRHSNSTAPSSGGR